VGQREASLKTVELLTYRTRQDGAIFFEYDFPWELPPRLRESSIDLYSQDDHLGLFERVNDARKGSKRVRPFFGWIAEGPFIRRR
jgi:hypothetical protein